MFKNSLEHLFGSWPSKEGAVTRTSGSLFHRRVPDGKKELV